MKSLYVFVLLIFSLSCSDEENMDVVNTIPGNTGFESECLNSDKESCSLEKAINNYRDRLGLFKLQKNESCFLMAKDQALDMAKYNYLSINRPEVDGRPAEPYYKRWQRYHDSPQLLSEQVSSGKDSAEKVLNDWLSSQSIRESFNSSHFNYYGLAKATSAHNITFWSLCLLTKH